MVSKIPGGGYVERRLPKIGKFALLISLSQFFGILFNGLLGWFPAGIIGTGSRGQKFHLLQYIRQNLNLPYKSNGFWSRSISLLGCDKVWGRINFSNDFDNSFINSLAILMLLN